MNSIDHPRLWIATVQCIESDKYVVDRETGQEFSSVFYTSKEYPIEYDPDHIAPREIKRKLRALVRDKLGPEALEKLDAQDLHDRIMVAYPDERIATLHIPELVGLALEKATCARVESVDLRSATLTDATRARMLSSDRRGRAHQLNAEAGGGSLSASLASISKVMDKVTRRGQRIADEFPRDLYSLMYSDQRSSGRSQAARLARERNTPKYRLRIHKARVAQARAKQTRKQR